MIDRHSITIHPIKNKSAIKSAASFVTKSQLTQVNKHLKRLQANNTPYVLFDTRRLTELAQPDYVSGVLTYLKEVDRSLSKSTCEKLK